LEGDNKGTWKFAYGMGKIAMGIVIGITVSRFPPTSAVGGGVAEG